MIQTLYILSEYDLRGHRSLEYTDSMPETVSETRVTSWSIAASALLYTWSVQGLSIHQVTG